MHWSHTRLTPESHRSHTTSSVYTEEPESHWIHTRFTPESHKSFCLHGKTAVTPDSHRIHTRGSVYTGKPQSHRIHTGSHPPEAAAGSWRWDAVFLWCFWGVLWCFGALPIAVGLLDAPRGRRALPGRLGGQLLARSLPPSGLTGSLLCTGHFSSLTYEDKHA